MRIATVLGTVTLNRTHPSLGAGRLKLVEPLDRSALAGGKNSLHDTCVIYDELGAGEGSVIAMSEGGEAAQPFRPIDRPVDAYNAAILDHVDIR